MNKLSLVSVASIAFLVTVTANAADLRPAYKAPAPVAAPVPWSWTGFYIGGHIGGGWGDKIWSEPTGSGGTTGLTDADGTVAGFLGGGQIGYNLQFMSNWVAGVEADVSWANIKGNFPCFDGINSSRLAGDIDSCSSKSDMLGTAVGRFGPTVDHAWVYVLGGAAWVRDHYTDNYFNAGLCSATFCATYSHDETRWGWTVGAGIEYAINANWSAKVQYNYMDFGTNRVTMLAPVGDSALGCPCHYDENIQQRLQTIKFGLNYRFDVGKAPVVAGY